MAAALAFPPALFDQLPAPMRNQIYDYLLPYTPRAPPGQTAPTTGMTLMQIIEAASMAGYASQTPRLRHEMFRLLELSMEHRPVPFTLLQDYLDHWMGANPHRDIRIEIDLNRSFAHARVEVEMYPFLMRVRNNPRMKISIRARNTTYRNAKAFVAIFRPTAGVNHNLNAALKECHRVIKMKKFFKWCVRKPPRGCPYDRKRWYDFLGKAVQGLIVQFQVNNDGLVIHTKKSWTPDWMISGLGSRNRGAEWMLKKQIQQWKVNAGLSEFSRTVPPALTDGETWRRMEARGSGYNAAAREE